KPVPGDPGILIHPIPGTQYALRLWPGSLTRREYCVDFVYAHDTFTPVNTPPEFELYSQLPATLPSWLQIVPQRAVSLERTIRGDGEIKAGTEKYVFADGLRCILVYPGADEPVRVDIPIRPV
ncbi:hypothetical protein C8Q76DRAFT_619302, partial [Earliella scabrosa]